MKKKKKESIIFCQVILQSLVTCLQLRSLKSSLFRQPLLIRSLNVFNSLLRRMLIKPKVNAKPCASGIDFDFQSGRNKYQLIKDETFMPTKRTPRSVTFKVRIFQRKILEVSRKAANVLGSASCYLRICLM